jgi:hypothetical protein
MIGEKDGLDRFLSSRSRRRRNSFFFLAHKQFDHGSVPAWLSIKPVSVSETTDRPTLEIEGVRSLVQAEAYRRGGPIGLGLLKVVRTGMHQPSIFHSGIV